MDAHTNSIASQAHTYRWKIGGSIAVSAILSFILGQLLVDLIPGSTAPQTWALSIVALFWFSALLINAFIITDKRMSAGVCVLISTALFIGSGFPIHTVSLAGILLATAFFINGFARARSEIRNVIKIKFFRIAYPAARVFLTGISFFAAFGAVLALMQNNLVIPQTGFSAILKSTQPVVSTFVPGFSIDASVHTAVEDIVRAQNGTNIPDYLVTQTADEILRGVSDSVGLTINGNDSLTDALYTITEDYIKNLSEGARAAILAGIGVLVFLVARSVLLIFGYIAIGFAYMVYKIAIAFGLMHIVTEETRKETIAV